MPNGVGADGSGGRQGAAGRTIYETMTHELGATTINLHDEYTRTSRAGCWPAPAGARWDRWDAEQR